ncbi:hypothetical protein FF021_11870 [Leptospira noguchii]|nr:hypothetical protein FF021_11870 [Leptospira noguchii]
MIFKNRVVEIFHSGLTRLFQPSISIKLTKTGNYFSTILINNEFLRKIGVLMLVLRDKNSFYRSRTRLIVYSQCF